MNQRPSLPPDRGYYFKFLKSDVQIVRFILEDNGFRESQNVSQQWSILWSTSAMQSQIYQQLQKYQKVNHFPKSIEVTRKDCMYKNISKMMSLYGQRHYPFIPKTYILPEEHRQLAEEMDKSPDIFWIVKPAASSQGKGIFVTNNYEEIPSKTNLIVSRYIDNPFLIDGFKFDLRIYLAITCINPLRLYMYEEGLVRFATVKYSNELELNKGNRFIHLTNYSVNKYSDSFLPNIDPNKDGQGSKWSLSALKRFLEKNGVNPSHLISQIEDILIKSVLSIEPIINSNYEMYVPFRDNCFELLGFDILIDNSLSPWLLEVNLSPSMNCDSPLDQKIKGDLLSDLFTMIGIVPLDLRTYINNNPINKINNQFNAYTKELSTNKGKRGNAFSQNRSLNSNLTKQDLEVIKESEEEFKR